MKRIISLALCFLLVFTLCQSVLAAGENVCEINGIGHPTLNGALTTVQNGETIRLLKDIDYAAGIVIEDKSITFDLNGYTLNVVNNAEADTIEEMSGLYVKGNAAVALEGEGEFNVTGAWFGVFAECDSGETASATVTNATGIGRFGVIAQRSKVTVGGDVTSNGSSGYGYNYGGVFASYNAEVTVEGDVYANGETSVGVYSDEFALVTVKGNIVVNDYNSRGIEAYDKGKVIVEKDITASGTGSIGIYSMSSNVTVGGNVTGDYGGIYAFRSDIDITGDVQTLGFLVNNYGVTATKFSHIYVAGDVRSNESGAVIWTEDNETPSQIIIGGVIEAPKYVQIGIKTLDFTDGFHTTSIEGGCYLVYEDPDNPDIGVVGVAEFAGGSGIMGDPYLVAHADQLYNVRNHLDKHFRQTRDINLSGYSTGEGWAPIGTSAVPFTGSFDGDGHTIGNLFISRGTSDYVGLFGYIGKTAEIRNLGLENAGTTGKNFVGSLIGYSMGKIMNSYSAGNVNGSQFVGGLVGYNFREGLSLGGTITSSYSSCTVTAMDFDAGGLAGRNARGVITNSFATGNVSSPVSVGGLVGASVGEVGNKNVGLITNSYATGEVSATVQDAGGLVGQNSALISYSFATGGVSCPKNVGGLAGYIYNWGRTENSYWDTITSDQNASAGGGTGKTTAEMKQQITYVDWDFTAIWGIEAGKNNGYPFLKRQEYEAEPTPPSAPQTFTATPGDGQVALSWTAPESDGGSAITKYQVSKDNGANWTDVGLNTSHTFTGLTNGTAYTFKVRAVNSVGNGAEASATATPTAATAPTYLVTVNSGTGGGNFAEGATVTITANAAPSGEEFDKWTTMDGVTFADANAATTSFTMTAKAVTVTATYKDLAPDTFAVTVQNDGNGTASANFNSAAEDAEITLTATPNSGYRFKEWQVVSGGVTITDNKFTMPAGTVTVKAIFEEISDETPAYKITDGANGSWRTDASDGTKIICDGDFAKFIGVKVNGSLISTDNYTAVSGSTVITLKPEYLATLSAGTYTVEILYTDGSVTTNLTVLAVDSGKPGEIPQTGDNRNMALLYVLMLLSGTGIFGTMLYGKKRRTSK